MFDLYKPEPALTCPGCGEPVRKWQGKDGPCALFVWVQGNRAPIDQPIDEDLRFPPEERAAYRLPAAFRLSSSCSGCGKKLHAEGRCEGEVWSQTWLP